MNRADGTWSMLALPKCVCVCVCVCVHFQSGDLLMENYVIKSVLCQLGRLAVGFPNRNSQPTTHVLQFISKKKKTSNHGNTHDNLIISQNVFFFLFSQTQLVMLIFIFNSLDRAAGFMPQNSRSST